jgi:hypothetical protein
MAALNFPAAPSVSDQYTANGKTWEWDGASWNIVPPNALLSTLGDVDITSLSSNEILKYDGTDWVNSDAIDEVTIGGTTAAAGTFTTFTSTGIDDNSASNALTIDSSSRMTASAGAAFVYNTTTTSTSKTLVNGEQCFVDTATQTLTLPASPSVGDNVRILVGNFTDTVVARNGSNIMGLAEDLTIDVANMGLTFIYTDASNGWRLL